MIKGPLLLWTFIILLTLGALLGAASNQGPEIGKDYTQERVK